VPAGVSVGLFYQGNLRRLPNFDPSARVPSALRLDLKASGDTVSISATVLYGDVDSGKAMGPLEKIPHEAIATHSGKLNDEVAFTEFERVGVEPVTFRIVPPQTGTPWNPNLRSDAPSIQIDFAPIDRTHGTLAVKNLAAKTVMAISVGSLDSELRWSQQTMTRIASGETYREQFFAGNSQSNDHGTCVEDPPSAFLALQAALFDDGSYEGKMRIAADLAAMRLAHDLQQQRIKSLAEPILADASLDVDAIVERIRAAINQLAVEPDADPMPRLHEQFPDLPESDLADLKLEFANTMKSEKETRDQELQRYQTDASTRSTRASFARWWALSNKD
jgi:hypothetical protein